MILERNKPLAPLTTLRVGGEARLYTDITTIAELAEAVRVAQESDLALIPLGGGSNVLIADGVLEALVVKIGLRGCEVDTRSPDEPILIICAGEDWDAAVSFSTAHGFWGLENLSGIPGSVGAAPIQNIGAYGVELSECVLWVEVFDTMTEKIRTMTMSECRFGYRHSVFKEETGRNAIVTRVALKLSHTPRPVLSYQDVAERFADAKNITPTDIREGVLGIRSKKFPSKEEAGSAGSFFKNPTLTTDAFLKLKDKFPDLPSHPTSSGRVKIPLAWLLERLGWKGKMEGAVGAFHRQPLVIANFGGASAQEVHTFARDIEADVRARTGILLEREVRSLGIFS